MIKIAKMTYDPAERSDGKRILVMHSWPRGIAKGLERIPIFSAEQFRKLLPRKSIGKPVH